MPSPFPGMDPFLEHPRRFGGLHKNMATYLLDALQSRLPSPYYADTGERIWVEAADRWVEPDAHVLRPASAPAREAAHATVAESAPHSTRPVVITVPHDECREPYVEIFAERGGRERLVVTIEILSPSNKQPGDHGRDLYLRKQRELTESKYHLVEIDLLRAGVHTTAVPMNRAVAKAGRFDYHVCVHRFDRWEDYLVYPIWMDGPLPEIAIPLLPGDGEVSVDLQAVLDRCYDTGPYRRRVDYANAAPVPPLTPAQADWAATRLREKGFADASAEILCGARPAPGGAEI